MRRKLNQTAAEPGLCLVMGGLLCGSDGRTVASCRLLLQLPRVTTDHKHQETVFTCPLYPFGRSMSTVPKMQGMEGITQGNCIKLEKNLVRLPESGRGAPCGRPSQGKTSRTVQIIVRSRKFLRSLATGGRFLVLKGMTIGRGAPCGRPSSAILASEFRCNCPGELLVPLTRSDLRGINGAIPA